MRLRQGGPADLPAVLEMFDRTVAWLAARGRSGQWGDAPWSRDPDRVRLVEDLVSDGMWVAEAEGSPAGVLTVREEAPAYAPPAGEPELYVRLLLVSREHTGAGVGGELLAFARRRALDRGIGLVRVDCWSGGDGALIRYYEGQGFTPTVRVPVGAREVQVLQLRP
ncbi:MULTISPECIES: GNAT family N-acetyltransferase [Nocardiopsidaceae]|uniref:GNAT family N-acetyltransferase n=1 Tax=Streptomonospora nanhaiensis TaxID=1323731 RepID=A0ABY6YRR5_9ACTN|nr:GNAT family N-acetyltransferase [Streptomonospora nanhaiensis]WAE74958.1 GNAT family N-acetyltransferase [Streptomonospora nanhaiensis]